MFNEPTGAPPKHRVPEHQQQKNRFLKHRLSKTSSVDNIESLKNRLPKTSNAKTSSLKIVFHNIIFDNKSFN
jgi:hypothetical protein